MAILKEDDIVVGNVYDKYGTRNPVARRLVDNFTRNVIDLVDSTGCDDVHEVGCGEGHLCGLIAGLGVKSVRGSDISSTMISAATMTYGRLGICFSRRSVNDLAEGDAADLIVCCEVMEHLEDPQRALRILAGLSRRYCLLSVPREPLWRALNVMRGKYLADLGNTPGHIQHWSRTGFLDLVGRAFEIVEVRSPLPWTIALCRPRNSP